MVSSNQNSNIVELFHQQVAQQPAATVIDFQGRLLNYQALDDQSNAIAAGLADMGVKKGDRIGLYCINSDSYVVTYLSIVKTGAAAVPLNLLLTVDELDYILNDALVSAVIYHPLFADNVSELRKRVVTVKYWIEIDENDVEGSWASLLTTSTTPPSFDIDPVKDLVSILYTSGTTGHPKGAMLSHRNLVSNTLSCFEALKITTTEDVLLVVIPMFHSFAHTVGMLMPMLHGACIVPLAKFDIQLVADAIERSKATIFMGVPTMYGMLLDLTAGEEKKFASIRYGISGGAAMPIELMKRFENRFNFPIYEGDGPTECSPVTCVNPIDGIRKPGSVGLPVRQVEMTIRDEYGNLTPDGVMGEICVRGPNVMKGYWQDPQATAAVFYADWYRTGDIGYRDKDSYFYIVDRLKDMLIVNGENVYPKSVEDVLYLCEGVEEVAVVGKADVLHGEVPVAYIVKARASILSETDIIRFCEDKLAKFEIPREVHFIESLPKTPTGKILKRELRKQGEIERGFNANNN